MRHLLSCYTQCMRYITLYLECFFFCKYVYNVCNVSPYNGVIIIFNNFKRIKLERQTNLSPHRSNKRCFYLVPRQLIYKTWQLNILINSEMMCSAEYRINHFSYRIAQRKNYDDPYRDVTSANNNYKLHTLSRRWLCFSCAGPSTQKCTFRDIYFIDRS